MWGGSFLDKEREKEERIGEGFGSIEVVGDLDGGYSIVRPAYVGGGGGGYPGELTWKDQLG